MEPRISIPETFAFISGQMDLGVKGYQISKTYADPVKDIQEREMAKLRKEGGKVKRNVTKRGSYLDDECKVHKIVPGPGKYHFADKWPVKAHLKPKYPERIT